MIKSNKLAFNKADTTKSIMPSQEINEKFFTETIVRLCREENHEGAARFFLEKIPEFMRLPLNPKDKLNHLMFLPRVIQAGGATKHGYAKLLRKVGIVEQALKNIDLPKNGGFIDLGCGAHDPLALATYYYLNGFTKCFGIDLLRPRVSLHSALSMYDILTNARAFPARYSRGTSTPGEINKRLRNFKLGAFEKGNFEAGFENLREDIQFREEDICSTSVEKCSISLVVSFAVLEHVSDIRGVHRAIYDLLLPGGVAFHFVDLVDHRVYSRPKDFTALSFLTEEDAPTNMNRLRAPEIAAAAKAAGFQVLKDKRKAIEVPPEFVGKVVARFRRFTPEELGTISQSLTLRKPAND